MKFKSGTITTELREEIAQAIATLQKAQRRVERGNHAALKLSKEASALEEEHAALSGKQTLTRSEATSETAIIAQKQRLAVALERAEGQAEGDRRLLSHTLSAVQPLLQRLLQAACEQLREEVAEILRPYFRQAGQLQAVARQTELEQNMVGYFRRATDYFSTLESTLGGVKTCQTILEAIGADADFFSLPAAEQAA